MIKALLVGAALVLAPASPTMAQTDAEKRFGPGIDAAIKAQDWAAARQLLSQLSDTGSARAPYILFQLDWQGKGAVADKVAAIKWLRLSGERGDQQALLNLGALYATGKDIPKDLAEARRWYGIAIAKGVFGARDQLAILEMNSGNFAEAMRLFRAGSGSTANACLARLLSDGSVAKDIAAANAYAKKVGGAFTPQTQFCLTKAAAAGLPEAQYTLAGWVVDGKSPGGVAMGLQMYEEAAANGSIQAAEQLAYIYDDGKTVTRDPAKALHFALLASPMSDHAAAIAGIILAAGDGVPADPARAIPLLQREDSYETSFALGTLYASGKGVPRNPEKAAELIASAAQDIPEALTMLRQMAQTDPYAMVELGDFLNFNFAKVPNDPARRKALYKQAAERGLPAGYLALAQMQRSDGDYKGSEATARKAVAANYAPAMLTLGDWIYRPALLGKDQSKVAEGKGLMLRAAQMGYVPSMYTLADDALIGGAINHGALNGDYGGPKPDSLAKSQAGYREAIRWREAARAAGDKDAIASLIGLYAETLNGQPFPGVADFAKALRLGRDLANRDGRLDDGVKQELAQLFQYGRGTAIDLPRAWLVYNYGSDGTPSKNYSADAIWKSMNQAQQTNAGALMAACQARGWKQCL